jgi:hypothetical protein
MNRTNLQLAAGLGAVPCGNPTSHALVIFRLTDPDSSVMHAPLTRNPNDPRLLAAIVGGLGFLLSAVIASIIASVASADADRWAAHSLMVRQASGHLFSLVQDAETGQRGFLLTGKDSYLGAVLHRPK